MISSKSKLLNQGSSLVSSLKDSIGSNQIDRKLSFIDLSILDYQEERASFHYELLLLSRVFFPASELSEKPVAQFSSKEKGKLRPVSQSRSNGQGSLRKRSY